MFEIYTYSIEASAGENGRHRTGRRSGSELRRKSGVHFYSRRGYHIDSVFVDEEFVGVVESYEFINVTSEHSISVLYAINTYTILSTSNSYGTIAPAGTTTLEYGSDITYSITPNFGCAIVDVLLDGDVSLGAIGEYTFENIAEHHTIAVTFRINQFAITVNAGENGTVTPGTTIVNYVE